MKISPSLLLETRLRETPHGSEGMAAWDTLCREQGAGSRGQGAGDTVCMEHGAWGMEDGT